MYFPASYHVTNVFSVGISFCKSDSSASLLIKHNMSLWNVGKKKASALAVVQVEPPVTSKVERTQL